MKTTTSSDSLLWIGVGFMCLAIIDQFLTGEVSIFYAFSTGFLAFHAFLIRHINGILWK